MVRFLRTEPDGYGDVLLGFWIKGLGEIWFILRLGQSGEEIWCDCWKWANWKEEERGWI